MHPFVCLACGKGFKYEHSLNFHIKSYHGLASSSSTSSSNQITSHVVSNKTKSARSSSSSSSSTPSINTTTTTCTMSPIKQESGSRMIHSTTGSNHRHSLPDAKIMHRFFDPRDDDGDMSDGQLSDDVTGDIKIRTGIITSSAISDHRSGSPGANSPSSNTDAGVPDNFSTKGIQIRSEKPLITLLEGHHPQSDQTYVLYKCSLCGFAFPCLEPILAHIQSMHSNQSSFTCDKCGATFKWRSELQLHEQLHKAMDQQQQSCTSPFPSIPSSSPPASGTGPKLSPGTGPLLMPSFLPPNLLLLNPFFDKLPSDANNGSTRSNGTAAAAAAAVAAGISINNSNNNNNTSLVANKNCGNSSGGSNNNITGSSGNNSLMMNSSSRKHSSSSSSNGSVNSHVNGHPDTFSEQVLNLSKGGSGERNPKSETTDRKGGRFDQQNNHHHNHNHAHPLISSPKRKHHPDGSHRDVKIEDRMSLMDESFHQQSQQHQSQQQPVPHHSNPHHALQLIPKVPSPLGEIEETSPGQFKCRYCDKTFDRIFSVHRHERVHTGYKPCICKVCGRGFSEKRNLRHHIIRFHSDGSGRELLKRARKDKSLAATTKQLAASVLKQVSAEFLSDQADSPTARSDHQIHPLRLESHNQRNHFHSASTADSDLITRMSYNNNHHHHHHNSSSSPAFSESRERNERLSPVTQDDECTNGKMLPDDDRSDHSHAGDAPSPDEREDAAQSPPLPISSSRRRKGKPSKKVVMNSHSTENSDAEPDDNEENESALHVVEDNDEDDRREKDDCSSDRQHYESSVKRQRLQHEEDYDEDEVMEDDEDEKKLDDEDGDVRRHGREGSESDEGNGSENSLEGTISPGGGRVRNHGAFFSSYSPRLGIVEKPIKRNEACRPLLGPDGKFLYPCGYCQKTFCSLSDLNRHMNFHEDVRPFKCQYCDYQSRTNSQLKVHMMRHAGIKQYLCTTCNYNGVTQSDLNRHCKTRSHILRSANVCPLCSLGFSTRILLQDHMDKFHESNPSDSSPPTPHPDPSDVCDLSVKSSRLHHHHRELITGDENSITA